MIAVGGSIGTGLFIGSGKALRTGGPAGEMVFPDYASQSCKFIDALLSQPLSSTGLSWVSCC